MNLRRITARAAVAGATTALVAGALVGATGTTANAAETSGDYTCAVPILGDQTFPLSLSVPLLPPTAPAGFPVTAGLLSYTSAITVPTDAANALGSLGVIGGNIDDFTMTIGNDVISAPGTYTANAPGDDGSVVMSGTGSNGAFNLPKAGSYNVKMPAAFTFAPVTADGPLDLGAGPVTVACATDSPSTLGNVVLTKQASSIAAKAVKKHRVTVVVKNEYTKPTGQVVAKVGKKSFKKKLNSAGKAVFAFPKSFKGKKAAISYKGDGYTSPTNKDKDGKKVVVKIK